jgi:hypothetical protein
MALLSPLIAGSRVDHLFGVEEKRLTLLQERTTKMPVLVSF